jgi:hypothetical protein
MRWALRSLAWALGAIAVAGPVSAQQNPLMRGTSTAPRFAIQNGLPVVTQHIATGLTPFPANCGDTSGTLYVGAEVEPHIAVNPLNPNHWVGAWQQDRYSNGASRGVVTGASFDGGVTWNLRTIPVSGCTGGSYARGTDPWVSFSPDGTVHQTVLGVTGSEANGVSAVIVSRSTDGGLTWSSPIEVIRDGAGFFNDKQTITADPTDARYVYAAWDRLNTAAGTSGGPTYFARSTNGGVSWEAARAIFTPGGSDQTIGNVIHVLPDGTLVNLMTLIHGTAGTVAVMRSTDKGSTWSAPISISGLGALGARDPNTGAPIRDGSIIPQMAVGPDGSLHVVWQDARFTLLRDAIAYSRSMDGGFTWSTPVRVNSNSQVTAFTPQVHVRVDGMVGVSFYDLRSDTSSPATLLTDFWIARSFDGATWSETRIADPFDISVAPNAGGYFLGDYTGLASAGTTFIAFYGKANSGATNNRTDIFAARISPPGAAPTGGVQKRAGPEREALIHRAEPMRDMDPGEDFRDAVRENTRRALEARRARLRETAPPMR